MRTLEVTKGGGVRPISSSISLVSCAKSFGKIRPQQQWGPREVRVAQPDACHIENFISIHFRTFSAP